MDRHAVSRLWVAWHTCPFCGARDQISIRRLRASDRRKARVLWLRWHPEYWKGWQGRKKDERVQVIIERMKMAGLLAPSTYDRDVNLDKLIAEAKKPHVDKRLTDYALSLKGGS